MNKTATELIARSENWLRHDVLPLWAAQGIDATSKGFTEALSTEGKALNLPRRALVQARQIYSFQTAAKLKLMDVSKSNAIVQGGVHYLIQNYLQENGSAIHAVGVDGHPHNLDQDLYTQAFALFALGCGFETTRDKNYKKHALRLLSYLKSERQAPGGGYTEIKAGQTLYQSNPHMHLFEAALTWLQIDTAPEWKALAFELFELCRTKFIDPKSGALCEHFNEGWTQQLESNGCFIFEPGHHYEWAWLMAWYQDLSGIDSKSLRHSIYKLADHYGINENHLAVDEVYSNFTVKKRSSRFWPQCERIKAAVKLGLEAHPSDQPSFAKSADQALTALFGYFNLPVQGLWQDMILETGEFSKQDPKASSLYHIINAMYEYTLIRPKIKDGV
ncbi:MAG: AGE family epimerase/isomerase [Bdellovibrio sp.]|nr:AGE family epimerase/isomerase [Bdellovibrio sp.]